VSDLILHDCDFILLAHISHLCVWWHLSLLWFQKKELVSFWFVLWNRVWLLIPGCPQIHDLPASTSWEWDYRHGHHAHGPDLLCSDSGTALYCLVSLTIIRYSGYKSPSFTGFSQGVNELILVKCLD
jgi:hypothetical protein